MALQLGGTVSRTGQGEYGRTELSLTGASPLCPDWPATSSVWMSHGDAITAVPDGFVATATSAGCAGGRHARPRAPALRAAVPPRGRAHRPRQRGLRPLPHRRVRVPAGLDPRLHHRAAGGRRAGPGGHRPGAVRAERRRRLGRGGGPGAQGGRRPAHLCLRRHRPHALGRGRPGRGHLPAPVQGRPRPREGGRPLLRRAGGRHRPRAQAQDHRRAVHPDLRGGGAGPGGGRSGDGR